MNAANTFTINCRGHLLDLSRPAVMGIINVNDDSFYTESRSKHLHQVLDKAAAHLQAGAAILDLGAQSTRPGAADIGGQAELDHLLPAIHAILHQYPQAVISVDTYRASVAEKALQAGAAIINDISAGELDPDMIHVAAQHRAPYIAMHMQGTPATMQRQPQYGDVVQEVLDYFIRKVAACREAGINDIIIDPGFGFGKTLAHNYTLLKHLRTFHLLQYPLLVGVSRKSMIYKLLETDAANALNGTTAVHTIALQQGAQLLRVHDVAAAVEAIRIVEYMQAQ
ncbi:dihydropteroate synthase [Chitinophaga pendula]|uniref:dihydropteroate synthase n=1 Tax=Chitinophaga TaxID=79328 RepID=UPI000BB0A456|nr:MULTISPECIES: dihydropteroate synthase [Chitinophaga]ASZ12828.1 dihydropteroate synthase [Chitinophaga sp. MD30]UCJ09545.1 dihydropteroate synthase [Chitinophaga pendula]